MQDFKSRAGAKGRKPGARRPAKRSSPKPPPLPRGFRPLAEPPPAQPPRRAPPLRGWLGRLRALGPGRLVFPLALAWLVLGLAAGAVALWRMPLAEVKLAGNERLTAEAVLEQAGLRGGMPMHTLSPYALARRLLAHPRVRRADVRRVFPDRVVIRLRERQGDLRVALEGGRTAIVDPDNVVLSLLPPGGARAPAHDRLPLLTGVPAEARERTVLAHPALRRGRVVLAALARLELAPPGAIVVEADDPLLAAVRLPAGRRLVFPYAQAEAALRTYGALAARVPRLFEDKARVDFSALRSDGTGRVVLRPAGR